MRSYESSGLIRAVTVWASAQLNQGPFRPLAPRVIQFGHINAGKPQANVANHHGVPIDDPAPAPQNGFHRERLGQVDPDGARRRPASEGMAVGAVPSSYDGTEGGLFRQTAAPGSETVPFPKLYPRFVIVIA